MRWVSVRNDTTQSVLSLGGRLDLDWTKNLWFLTAYLRICHNSWTCEAKWKQNSLTQVSSALHRQPTFLEADASDTGIHHECWDDLKFFCDYILQTDQYQRDYKISLLPRWWELQDMLSFIKCGQSHTISTDKVWSDITDLSWEDSTVSQLGGTALLPGSTEEEDSWRIALGERVVTAS